MKLNTELRRLAEFRMACVNLKEQVSDAQYVLERSPEYLRLSGIKEALKSAQAVADAIEKTVRELGTAEYEKSDKTTKKFRGYSIAEGTVVEVLDEKKAKQWAAISAPSTLALTRDFEKAIKNLELDFVKVTSVHNVRIASDLSEFLDDPTEPEDNDLIIPF